MPAFLRQYGQSSCESCIGAADNDQSVRDDVCREQYEDYTPEQYFCLTSSLSQRNKTVLNCLSQPECCDASSEPLPNPCGRCIGNANANVAECYKYCDFTTEPGTEGRVNCIEFCNAALYSTKLACSELGLCVDQCALPRRNRM